ncbi:MAG: DNA polymerase III subunit beta [Lentisphaerae bacterium GWF2_52_8]|nr:MAG: DNA polymerase III subunit beta [Lentisphaerae bacterium GWF2_52_8]
MKFVCETDLIQKNISYLQGVIMGKSSAPISALLIESTGTDSITLSSTDLTIGMKIKIPAEVEKGGKFVVPSKKFSDIIRKLPPRDKVTAESSEENNKMTLKVSKSIVCHMLGYNINEVPDIPVLKKDNRFEMPQKLLKDMMLKTSYAIAKDEIRYALNGAFIEEDKGKISMVATDGHRLSFIEKQADSKGIGLGIIIPSKTISELVKLLGEEGNVACYISDTNIFFEFENILLVSRLLDGKFPNYKQIIPRKFEGIFTVDKAVFTQAIDRVSVFAYEKNGGMLFNVKKDVIEVIARSPEFGDAQEIVELASSDFDGMEISFNFQYLMDVFRIIDSATIEFNVINSSSPVLIKGEDADQINIVMPMRL